MVERSEMSGKNFQMSASSLDAGAGKALIMWGEFILMGVPSQID